MIHIFYTPIRDGQASRTAHALAGTAYRRLTGELPPQILKYPGGKPYFSNGSWHLSISHTRQMALCALADQPVGLDAEQPRPVPEKLRERCLAEPELAVCRAAADPDAAFLRFWTLKEAYAKYDGCGIVGFPNRWCFALEGSLARLQGRELWFQTLTVENLTVSVCSAGPQSVRLHPVHERK